MHLQKQEKMRKKDDPNYKMRAVPLASEGEVYFISVENMFERSKNKDLWELVKLDSLTFLRETKVDSVTMLDEVEEDGYLAQANTGKDGRMQIGVAYRDFLSFLRGFAGKYYVSMHNLLPYIPSTSIPI